MTDQPLTVEDVIVRLLQLPLDALVIADGCDCMGDVVSVAFEGDDAYGRRAILARSFGRYTSIYGDDGQ